MTRILLALIFTFHSVVYACDFSKDIKQNSDGSYTYSRECHIEAGKAVKRVSLLEEKIDLVDKKLELKDLMITKQEDRTQLWIQTSMDMHEKLQKYEDSRRREGWLNFGLGVGVTILSVWAAGQITK